MKNINQNVLFLLILIFIFFVVYGVNKCSNRTNPIGPDFKKQEAEHTERAKQYGDSAAIEIKKSKAIQEVIEHIKSDPTFADSVAKFDSIHRAGIERRLRAKNY